MISVIARWPEASIVSREVRRDFSNGETRVKGSGRELSDYALGNDRLMTTDLSYFSPMLSVSISYLS
jgi:hypothetical protein